MAVEYIWSKLAFVAQGFDHDSSSTHGTGRKVLHRGATEALGCTDQLYPHLFWPVSGVEHVNFITGGVEDCTLSTVFTHRFES